MQNPTSLRDGARKSMASRYFGWFLSWRTPGRILVGVAAIATLVGLFYVEENWRGKHDWEAYKRQLETRGVELDWNKFIPPAVPDDQNFAMTPFLVPLFDFNPRPLLPGQSPWRNGEGWARTTNFASAFAPTNEFWKGDPFEQSGGMTDLASSLLLLQRHTNSDAVKPSFSTRTEAASAVLGALAEFEPVLDELRAASRRPCARFNISYNDDDPAAIMVSHLSLLRRLSRVLQVRASAELELGKTEAAGEDARFLLFLAESVHDEPLIISHAVRLTILRSAQQIIWEGLAGHRWSDSQLQDFQARLQTIASLKDLYRSMMAERAAFGVKFFEFIRSHPNSLRDLLAQEDNDFWAFALLAAPQGWLYQEEISCQRLYEEKVFHGFDPQSAQIHPRIIDNHQARAEKKDATSFSDLMHHRVFSKLLVPNLFRLFQFTAVAQTGADQAALACALERYRIANGRFPETLASLAPRFIGRMPRDVCNGQPLKYHRTDDGSFVLYSVGWNGKDDGGMVVTDKEGKALDRRQGDWVWPRYPDK